MMSVEDVLGIEKKFWTVMKEKFSPPAVPVTNCGVQRRFSRSVRTRTPSPHDDHHICISIYFSDNIGLAGELNIAKK